MRIENEPRSNLIQSPEQEEIKAPEQPIETIPIFPTLNIASEANAEESAGLIEMQELQPEAKITQWLTENLIYYQEIFSFSEAELRDKKILEIGAFDRRLAAALISTGISSEVFSLEPALGTESKEGYAEKDTLVALMNRLPKNIRDEIEKRTIIAEAEAIPVEDQIYDFVISKSVPHASLEQLARRINELLRVGKEVRLYPITPNNRNDYESVLRSIESLPITYEYITTTEDDVPTEGGVTHIKEDVLILRKKNGQANNRHL